MSATAIARPNIALVKYWGKANEDTNEPIHGSLSVTLDVGTTKTVVKNADQMSFNLNGEQAEITGRLNRALNIFSDGNRRQFEITSTNDFPTAAGFASSAAGAAAFVVSLASFVGETEHPIEFWAERNIDLTQVAQMVSGSGCRSLHGGFVEWRPSETPKAVQLFDHNHWKDLVVLSINLKGTKKDVSSTNGMRRTVDTVPWIQWRATEVVPKRIKDATEYIASRDFDQLSEIIMRESNELHANCAATFPPIRYLMDQSYTVINEIHRINKSNNRAVAAYTFDAGPNPFVFCQESDLEFVKESLLSLDVVNHSQIRIARPAPGSEVYLNL